MTQEQINSLLAKPATKSCTWTEDADGNWHTGCQQIHVIIVGSPPENGYVYCPYCGSKIETVIYNAQISGGTLSAESDCSQGDGHA